MAVFQVKSRDGTFSKVEARPGTTLMEALYDAGLVEATCGGAASCGTCHVYFETKDLSGERTEDEGYMLESLEDFVEVKPGSRLACQVRVTDQMNDAALEVAPEA